MGTWNSNSLSYSKILNVLREMRGLMVVAMLYVEKDLAQCVKVVFDKWDGNKDKLNHQYFYVANCRLSPREFKAVIQKSSAYFVSQT